VHGRPDSTASMRDVYDAPAILLIGNNPTDEHPLLAWQIRNNVRLHGAKLYVINHQAIKLQRQAVSFTQIGSSAYNELASSLASGRGQWAKLAETLRAEQNLVIIFGSEIVGDAIASLAKFTFGISGAKLISLADYANSRGAADMGLYPDLLPGYNPLG